ncbi:MAG: MMPL family transporter [archaeon]
MDFKSLYSKHYKKLVFIPLLFLLFDLIIISGTYMETGDFINKDVSLQGGTTATIYSDAEFQNIQTVLKNNFPESDVIIRDLTEFGTEKRIGIIIEATHLKSNELQLVIEEEYDMMLTPEIFSVEEVGSALGESFYKQMLVAMGLAFLFMSIVVLIIFRSLIPSFAVVLTALTDIITTIAIIDLLGIKISAAGIAALLMLIGYSIDTDMLLTTKMLKRKDEGTTYARLKTAITTGLTMTITTLVALLVALPISQSQVLKQMFTIIIIGLIVDVFMTYCFNAGILVWYLKKKQGQ